MKFSKANQILFQGSRGSSSLCHLGFRERWGLLGPKLSQGCNCRLAENFWAQLENLATDSWCRRLVHVGWLLQAQPGVWMWLRL